MATTANIYLTFNGNCEAAFKFYQSVFGGEFTYLGRFGQMPPDPQRQVPDSDMDRIMHVGLPIGNSVLMGSDVISTQEQVKEGNNFSVSVVAESRAEADRLFSALSAAGTVIMPMQDTFWGAYFGMCTDRFGINWMMNYSVHTS